MNIFPKSHTVKSAESVSYTCTQVLKNVEGLCRLISEAVHAMS